MSDHDHPHDHGHSHGGGEHSHDHDPIVITTRELIRNWLQKKVGVTTKRPATHTHATAAPAMPSHGQINTIAIVLDGVVQEVIRAENRMAALLLSEPHFVLVKDTDKKPTLNWIYNNGKFTDPDEENKVSDN